MRKFAAILILILPMSLVSAQDCQTADAMTGTPGAYTQPDAAGTALNNAYPEVFRDGSSTGVHLSAIINIVGIFPGGVDTRSIHQPNTARLFRGLFPMQDPKYGINSVRLYDTSSNQDVRLQAFLLRRPIHTSFSTLRFCIMRTPVPNGGYVNVRGQKRAFYTDGIAAGGGLVPAKLTSFSARHIREQLKVKWRTATEHDSYVFAIERLMDGKACPEVDLVKSAGSSNSPRSFRWTDQLDNKLRRNAKLVYRVLQMDLHRSTNYSNLVNVAFGPASAFVELHGAWPNPLKPTTAVSLTPPEVIPVTKRVQNMFYRNVIARLMRPSFDTGVHTVNINDTRLPTGPSAAKFRPAMRSIPSACCFRSTAD